MRTDYKKYRGISLSVIIKRDLKKLKMTQKSLSSQINMSYSHFNHILNTSCKFPINVERRIEDILGYEVDFLRNLRNLQLESRVEDEKNKKLIDGKRVPSIRKCVFWDINIDSLDWSRHRKFIIARINRYGNDQEKKSVTSFYNL